MTGELPQTKRDLLVAARPPHVREPWPADGCGHVLVHGRLSVMKGTEEGSKLTKEKMAVRYEAAKIHNDMDAANEIVEAMWRAAVYEELLQRVISSGKRPIIISPHPAFDDDDAIDADAPNRFSPRNALPFAFAARLRAMLDGLDDDKIVQGARVGRTKLLRFPKFVFQPHFVGDVSVERPYIVVDDNVGLGGTLAALYGHIARNGGTVLGMASLAHSTGKNVPFALTGLTRSALYSEYGADVCALWKEEIGHEVSCLTEGEAGFLIDWQSGAAGLSAGEKLHRLRARLAQARATFK